MVGPLRFEPFLRPMVWGGRRLAEVLRKPLPTDQAYGESWEVSDHPVHRSVAAVGRQAGRTLRQLMDDDRAALLGPAAAGCDTFPWLVKFLDARDWLSVQVHPNERMVCELCPGEGSKTEAWFVLAADPGSRVYAGLLPGVDEARLRQALNQGTVAECLHQLTPRPGDCIFLPAGTVHAVGGGVLMAEVQQTSDATFRLFDWNRRDSQGKSRQLHIEEAIASIDWSAGPVEPIRVRHFGTRAGPGRQGLVQCPYFALDYVHERAPFAVGGKGQMQLLVVLEGSGVFEGVEGSLRLEVGQAWVLPAALATTWVRPEPALGCLLCTYPGQAAPSGRA